MIVPAKIIDISIVRVDNFYPIANWKDKVSAKKTVEILFCSWQSNQPIYCFIKLR